MSKKNFGTAYAVKIAEDGPPRTKSSQDDEEASDFDKSATTVMSARLNKENVQRNTAFDTPFVQPHCPTALQRLRAKHVVTTAATTV